MNKYCLLIVVVFAICACVSAQELAPVLITPVGDYTETSQGSLSWSIGELAIQEVVSGSSILSQGFQQIEIDTSSVALPNDPKKLLLLIPNVITPNGDGFNDLFDPVQALREVKIQVSDQQTKMTIVNRWGEVVFVATQPYRAWDGKSSLGIIMPQATYYFILNIEATNEITLQGSVNLLR